MKVATLEMPEQLDLAAVQEKLDGSWQSLADSGRRVLLAYVGLWSYVYDGACSLVGDGVKLLESAEARGVKMENALTRRFRRLEAKASDEINKLQGGMDNQVLQVRKELSETREEVEDELERQVQAVLTNLGIPSRERLDRLNQEIDLLNQRIDEELRKSQAGASNNLAAVV